MISPKPVHSQSEPNADRQRSDPVVRRYVGRFAPSPTGPLHQGSLVTAMASYLDALAQDGRWLVRIEDVDRDRCSPRAAREILSVLEAFGFVWDGEVTYQSTRDDRYLEALELLQARNLVYPCSCSRREIADSIAFGVDGAPIYPGTCRSGTADPARPRAWRLRVGSARIAFADRLRGPQAQDLGQSVGDFIVRRADDIWSYQLAVVVDDALQGVTDVVRGDDLAHSTARQIFLQQQLGLATPRYLHVPVLTNNRGEKLSKQTGAVALDCSTPLQALHEGARHLGLGEIDAESIARFWTLAALRWKERSGQARSSAGETSALTAPEISNRDRHDSSFHG